MMHKQKNECSSVLLICVCMRAHTIMNTVTPHTLSAVLMYIDVFIYWCNHLPIYPSIYTRQHSYSRTRGHLLTCTRVRTHTCGHPCFHAQKCSKDPRRCWCALSSQEKSQVKDAACVQLNASCLLVSIVEHMLHPWRGFSQTHRYNA